MNNKKSLVALILVAIIGIVGLTLAYFSNTTSIDNEFKTREYATTVEEVFESPDDWLPGDTTDKKVEVTNSGEVDEAVRISISQAWTTKNNGTLNGWIHADGTKSDHLTESELANDERVAIINLDNTSDWTKVGDYYYYNYKLAPGDKTSSFMKSVTFNENTKLDDTCGEAQTINGVITIICNSSGNDYDDATYTLTLTIETVQYNKYNEAWNLNNSVTISANSPINTLKFIANNTNPSGSEYNDEGVDKGQMFVFTHGTEPNQTVDYRYIGNEPKNYVKFNCDNDGTNCEIWRIIGVFDVDDGSGNVEKRMKLVRGSEFTAKMVFNSIYKNDWTISPLNTFLNGDYYNRDGDAATYGLKASAQGMIDNAVYYLGAVSWNSTINGWGSTNNIYSQERGTTLCGSCNSDATKLTWVGKVGLMYASDEYMVYGNGVKATCYDDPNMCYDSSSKQGWVFNSNIKENTTGVEYTWLLSSYAGYSDNLLCVNRSGKLGGSASSNDEGVRPVVYLKSSVKIIDGTGEAGNPYVLR